MAVPYTFGNATTSIPLSQLDTNFATAITLGNTAIQLGNTVTTLNNMTLANVTISSGNTTVTSETISGNLTFTGTGNRITGDFSNATVANRVAFQTSTANSPTSLMVIPNGTSTTATLNLETDSALSNGSFLQLNQSASETRINSTIRGTGTYLPITFYTGGSERMRIDTSGNVGIGTSSPATQFVVSNAGAQGVEITGSNGAVQVYNRSTSAYGTMNLYANTLYFRTGASPAINMTLDSSGNVGIGTTSPVGKLHVSGDVGDMLRLDRANTGAVGNQIAFRHSNAGTLTETASINAISTANADTGTLVFYTKPTGGSNTERMRIDTNGNVGIGTASPTAILTVAGPASFQAPSTKTANYSMTATDSSLIFNGSGSITLTLQAASSYTGRILYVKTIAAQTVVSASSNVVPVGSATAGTAILAATAGKWAMLQSDGTNWVIMAAN